MNILKDKLLTFNLTDRITFNIIGSFIIKGFNVIITYLLVPISIQVLNVEKYGIWLTIFSLTSWFNIMDIGLGNGFRNRYAESLANNDTVSGNNYIKVYYSSMGIITIILILLIITLNPLFDWKKILNVGNNYNENLNLNILVVFLLFSIQFYSKNISTVLLSIQKTSLTHLLFFLSNLLTTFCLFIFYKLGIGSLMLVSIVYMSSPIIVNLIAHYYVFKNYFKSFEIIKFKFPNRIELLQISGIGLQFFIIQITSIVLFSSGNFIISRIFGPNEVTIYNIAFRLFSSFQLIFSIIIAPYWTAFTEAYVNNNFSWMKSSIRSLTKISFFLSGLIFIVLIFSSKIIEIWLGKVVFVDKSLLVSFAINSLLLVWSSLYSYFLAGIGKVRIALYISIFQLIFFIPLALSLANMFGSFGIVMAINICLSFSLTILYYQVNKILNGKADGLWLK